MAVRSQAANLPNCLYLETTNRCNLRCRTCIVYRGGWEPERDISLEEVRLISEQLPELERAVLHGIGEPLLNQDLPAMIRHLKDREVTVLFNTNGILLNDKRQAELIDSNLDELRVSLDAASPDGYKAIRDSDKFDLIINNLQTFAKRLESKKLSKPKLTLWFLGNKENITELPKLIDLAAAIGIGEVYMQRLVYFLDNEGFGVARSQNTLTNPDVAIYELIEQSQEQARQLGILFGASGLTAPVDSVRGKNGNRAPWKGCIRPWEVIYITAHGNVLPCCISPFSTMDYPSIILGNVFESTVADVWFGDKYRDFRKLHQTSTPPKCCRGCGICWSL
ncbi:MAG: radical SAM protein [Deltaproteobacteria bacterium]|nr:MAG: radical SAM protein [Deltaproteobacteria bacterium]